MSVIENRKLRRKVQWLNLAFWVVLVASISFGIGMTVERDRSYISLFLQGGIGMALVIIPITYFNSEILIPRFLVKRKYWRFVLAVVLISIVWPPLPLYIDNLIDEHLFHVPEPDLDNPLDYTGPIVILFAFVLSTMVNMAFRWVVSRNKLDRIENERLNTELAMLKNQINPHFFFNTLNNLYSLALEQSKETPKMILKLSEMMRYSIYECNGSSVPLSSEVVYLENYLGLQQIRLHTQSHVEFERRIINEEATICPMVLIVFLENAFKHGALPTKDDAGIQIHLSANETEIHFKIENTIEEGDTSSDNGIGLENVKKRLNLVYGDRHDLFIGKRGNRFCVDLSIRLEE